MSKRKQMYSLLFVGVLNMAGCSTWGSGSATGSAGVQRPHSPAAAENKQAPDEQQRQQVSGRSSWCNITPLILETMSRDQRCYTYNQMNKAQQQALMQSLSTEQNLKFFGGCTSP